MKKFVLLVFFIFWTSNVLADCIDDAAAYHGVNPWILRAITFQESSFRPDLITKNKNNTIDVGATGTNSVHFPELQKFGIYPRDLLDPCKSVYVAAWLYRKKINKYGNSWTAVGAYHSENSPHMQVYIAAIQGIMGQWSKEGRF